MARGWRASRSRSSVGGVWQQGKGVHVPASTQVKGRMGALHAGVASYFLLCGRVAGIKVEIVGGWRGGWEHEHVRGLSVPIGVTCGHVCALHTCLVKFCGTCMRSCNRVFALRYIWSRVNSFPLFSTWREGARAGACTPCLRFLPLLPWLSPPHIRTCSQATPAPPPASPTWTRALELVHPFCCCPPLIGT